MGPCRWSVCIVSADVSRGDARDQPRDKCQFGRIAATTVAVRRDGKRRRHRLRATFCGRRVRRWRWTDIGDGRSRRCGGVTKTPKVTSQSGRIWAGTTKTICRGSCGTGPAGDSSATGIVFGKESCLLLFQKTLTFVPNRTSTKRF